MFQTNNALLYFILSTVFIAGCITYINLDNSTQIIDPLPLVRLHRKGNIVENIAPSVIFPLLDGRNLRKTITPFFSKNSSTMRTRISKSNPMYLKVNKGIQYSSLSSITNQIRIQGRREVVSNLKSGLIVQKNEVKASLLHKEKVNSTLETDIMEKADGFPGPMSEPFPAPLKSGYILALFVIVYGIILRKPFFK